MTRICLSLTSVLCLFTEHLGVNSSQFKMVENCSIIQVLNKPELVNTNNEIYLRSSAFRLALFKYVHLLVFLRQAGQESGLPTGLGI